MSVRNSYLLPLLLLGAWLGSAAIAEPPSPDARAWVPQRPSKVVMNSKGAFRVLQNRSVEFTGGESWRETTLYFQFKQATRVDKIQLELLPAKAAVDGRLGPQAKRLMLFDVKPYLGNRKGGLKPTQFAECTHLENPRDESTANAIDFLTDTGWTVPPLADGAAAHHLILRFGQPLEITPRQSLALTIDSGGSPELDVVSRVRVSFVGIGER